LQYRNRRTHANESGLTAAQKKFGGAQGEKMSKNKAMNEKITDGVRGLVEKLTG
jgi:hypothetical protein